MLYKPVTTILLMDAKAYIDLETQTELTVLKNRTMEARDEFFRAEKDGLCVVAKEVQSFIQEGSFFWILMELGDVKAKLCTMSENGRTSPERWFSEVERLRDLSENDRAWVKGAVRKIRKLAKVKRIQER
jgi:hypothetical protein